MDSKIFILFILINYCYHSNCEDVDRGSKQIPLKFVDEKQSTSSSTNPQQQQQEYQNSLNYYQPHQNYGNPRKQQNQQQKQFRPQLVKQKQKDSEQLTSSEERELQEYEEEQKPDRLTELLATSKFSCQGKKDGYYADAGLNCEVFHYCQDSGKHSWLCPNQFAFHQIHLICVPPSSDNICKQSSDFHFVNDYLYKPINQKEANFNNTSLKYADRFFPDGYQAGGAELMPYEDTTDEDEQSPQQQQPQQPQQHRRFPQQQQQPYRQPQQQQQQNFNQYIIPRQQQQLGSTTAQRVIKPNYFTNPESINIPLTNRRPIPTNNNFKPSPQLIKTNYY